MNIQKQLILLSLLGLSLAYGDELVLNNGARYKGTVSRNAKGQVEIATSKGTFSYDDEKVNFKQTKINEPSDFTDYQNALKKKDFAKIKTVSSAWGKRFQGMPVRWNEMALYGKALAAVNDKKKDEALKIFEEYFKLFPKGAYKGEIDVMNLDLRSDSMSKEELIKTYSEILERGGGSEAANARMHLALAKLQLEAGDNWKALENFASVVVLYGDIPDLETEALWGCGSAYEALGQAGNALFYYEQMAENNDCPYQDKAKAKVKELKK
jgi:tetratricopeptide (TPR) repeat protein